MKYVHLLLVLILIASCTSSLDGDQYPTRFETSDGQESAPYKEGIAWWNKLDKGSYKTNMITYGSTDAGLPLHLVILGNTKMTLDKARKSNKTIILINNAIHPGEPDGVDASMMLYRDILAKHTNFLDSCILVCIPYYNIGGALNRNSTSRSNQEGPLEYGFRGNAQNLDLNRDFIKCDSRNAKTFARLLQELDPDVYVETHVSNGADYQYNITYLSTQTDKLNFTMGAFLSEEIIPGLEHAMHAKNQDMVPYVNIHGGPLDTAYSTFYDSPRYSSGLTSLHGIYGFITETHMLKPYKPRVEATYDYLMSTLEFCYANSTAIQSSRLQQTQDVIASDSLPIDWKIDESESKVLTFKGYEFGYKPSEVSGEDRLFYNRTKPITKPVKFKHKMTPTAYASKPSAYIISQGYHDVIERLQLNGVSLDTLSSDTTISVFSYVIKAYETVKNPYEKHYMHYDTKFSKEQISWTFRKGDVVLEMGNKSDRFVMEVLEPNAPDSYFNWNFFDAVLQQKEGFSSYVFEDEAAALLVNDDSLNKSFKAYVKDEKPSPRQQLYWIYKNSDGYEKEHMRLPVFMISKYQ